ncbi:MAG: hypothetical protein Q4G10_05535 [Bacteroidia bacterium]|nr:hypothetical protein [Bacteroidia bacterium]
MRKTKSYISAGILAAVALSLVSCEKIVERYRSGEEIKFAVASGSVDTKASYSGAVSGIKERIDWQNGDLMRIYCAEASTPDDHYSDYSVSSVETPSSGSAVSTAHIVSSGESGLRWGEDGVDHHFYAVFPSPSAGGATQSISANTVTASIPASQGYVGTISQTDGNYIAAPDLKNMVMTAKATYTTETFPDDDEVFLSFTPLTTAIQFVIKNDTGGDLKLTAVQLISGDGKTSSEPVISGAFSVNLNQTGVASGTEVKPFTGNDYTITYGQDYPLCTSTAATSTDQAADRTLTISVGTEAAPLTLAAGKTFTFTFFLNPVSDFNDLTFKLIKTGGNWQSTRLGYTDGDGVFFPRHKKSTVAGLLIPEGAVWHVGFYPEVINWLEAVVDDSGHIDLTQPLLSEGAFVSNWSMGEDEDISLTEKGK